MSESYFKRHNETLDRALEAIHKRGYWSPFPESPSPRVYGEDAAPAGEQAFTARLGRKFELDQPGTIGWVGKEVSPYGIELDVTYPQVDIGAMLAASSTALAAWKKAGPETWAGVCLEILHRINKRSFEMAHAVMHTTGQGFVMSFQAAGPHAQDRGLEAVAYAWDAMSQTPHTAHWEKPQGKHDPLRVDKFYRVVPRGVGLVIGVSTFPTWNGYPAIFADLATGNAVVVKPHPGAILPLAITVEICREVIGEAGFDANLVQLAADEPARPIAKELALRPEIRIIDYTGGPAFGTWLEQNAHQATVYTEKAGINWVVIDSTDNLKGMLGNLAFSLSLYSGQMCTTPQNIYVPRGGITADGQKMSFDEVADAIGKAIERFLSDPDRAVEVLGAVQSEATWKRVDEAAKLGDIVLPSRKLKHPKFEKARVRSPLILKLDGAKDAEKFGSEMFGPIACVVAVDDARQALALAGRLTREKGAITAALYSLDEGLQEEAIDVSADAGVALSINLTGGVYVNQSAAFSDFHATGANPAANASLVDYAFVANRFRVVQHRLPSAA